MEKIYIKDNRELRRNIKEGLEEKGIKKLDNITFSCINYTSTDSYFNSISTDLQIEIEKENKEYIDTIIIESIEEEEKNFWEQVEEHRKKLNTRKNKVIKWLKANYNYKEQEDYVC